MGLVPGASSAEVSPTPLGGYMPPSGMLPELPVPMSNCCWCRSSDFFLKPKHSISVSSVQPLMRSIHLRQPYACE